MAKRRKRSRSSSSPIKRTKMETKKDDTILCFQDVWKDHCSNNNDTDNEVVDEEAVSNVFFELANAPSVSYRLEAPPTLKSFGNGDDTRDSTSNVIVIHQDVSGATQSHTGGIVWETSYLLLNYLLSSKDWLIKSSKRKTILEIGAGCGMLGLSLHKAFELGMIGDVQSKETAASRVVITETNEVMDNLRQNLERNYPRPSHGNTITSESINLQNNHELHVEELDWTRYQEDCTKAEIKPGSVDCIVGTDVVFSTRFVRPMLETMKFLSHCHTVVYLCLQERCKDSHELLLGEAIHYGFRVEDISETVYNDAALEHSCGFGRALECKLLKFTVFDNHDVDRHSKKKKKKKKNTKEF